MGDEGKNEWESTPYGRGCIAAYDAKTRPECPYADGSKEAEEWWDGFSDGIDTVRRDP